MACPVIYECERKNAVHLIYHLICNFTSFSVPVTQQLGVAVANELGVWHILSSQLFMVVNLRVPAFSKK